MHLAGGGGAWEAGVHALGHCRQAFNPQFGAPSLSYSDMLHRRTLSPQDLRRDQPNSLHFCDAARVAEGNLALRPPEGQGMAFWDPVVPGHPGEAGPRASGLMWSLMPCADFRGYRHSSGDPWQWYDLRPLAPPQPVSLRLLPPN